MSMMLLALCTTAAAQPAANATGFLDRAVQIDGAPIPYVLYVPADYDPARAWPLVVFLHGAGERGGNPWLPTEVGIGSAIRRNPRSVPGLVLFPQCPEGKFWDAAIPAIEAEMADVRAAYRVDPRRIYLTGISMGGYMTWLWGARKTDTFAAFMPICGGGNLIDIMAIIGVSGQFDFGTLDERVRALATRPIAAYHGADDDVVPPQRSRDMVEKVRAAGGNIHYREFADTGHNSWDKAYGSRIALRWLFDQRLPE